MSKFVVIEGDYNDGDYSLEKNPITEEELIRLKEIVSKMPKEGEYILYETREHGDDDKPGSNYDFITDEEKDFLSKFLPDGDSNYPGIHTIESIFIMEELEVLL